MLKKKKGEKLDITAEGFSSRDQLMGILTNSIDDVFIILSGDDCTAEYVSPNVERVLGVPVKEVEKNIANLGKAKYMDDKEITYQTIKEIEIGSSLSHVVGREHKRTKDSQPVQEYFPCQYVARHTHAYEYHCRALHAVAEGYGRHC